MTTVEKHPDSLDPPAPVTPAAPDNIEEIQAFCFIAGFALTVAGQGWTDGTGVIHGCSWKLQEIRTKRHSTFEGYPSLAGVKNMIQRIRSGQDIHV